MQFIKKENTHTKIKVNKIEIHEILLFKNLLLFLVSHTTTPTKLKDIICLMSK